MTARDTEPLTDSEEGDRYGLATLQNRASGSSWEDCAEGLREELARVEGIVSETGADVENGGSD